LSSQIGDACNFARYWLVRPRAIKLSHHLDHHGNRALFAVLFKREQFVDDERMFRLQSLRMPGEF
jgi:hypothetical protein